MTRQRLSATASPSRAPSIGIRPPSLTDDDRLLVSHNKVPAELRVLFERQLDRIHLPQDEHLRPHRDYVARHREGFMAA